MIKTRRDKWYADPSNLQNLQAMLESPVMQAAMAVLEEDKRPRTDSGSRSSADALTYAAFKHEQLAGFFEYPEMLKELADSEPTGPQSAPDAYSDDHVKAYAKEHGMEIPDEENQPA
jgi:hypothetical protein